jgi:histidinol phosphatase-like enzyme
MPKASVKVMNSYDYCHFEICLGSDEDMSLDQINGMRKDAQRLVDKAVEQYKIAKNRIPYQGGQHSDLEKQVKIINENFPKSEWTPQQKATVKAYDDFRFYDYQDDWEE